MSTFANIDPADIKYDCRFYTGYKPCHRSDSCIDCGEYRPRGEQILVIKLGAMGDVLRSKVVLKGLKARHPESWIVWVTRKGCEPIVRDPLVDEIRTLSAEDILALEGRVYTEIHCLDKDAEALSLSRKLEGQRKFGYAPTAYNTVTLWNDASIYSLRLGLSDELKFHKNEKTAPEIVAEMSEVPYAGERYTLTLSDQARQQASSIWNNIGFPKNKKVIGINTGCGPVFATKAWTLDGLKGFLRLLGDHDDCVAVLLGGVRERSIHEELKADLPDLYNRVFFDSGTENPLEAFFGLVELCDLLISADSLAMHVALALETPVVAWFGPTCGQEVALFGLGEKIVTDFSCSPCYLKVCPKDVTCMEAMTSQTVYTTAMRVLDGVR